MQRIQDGVNIITDICDMSSEELQWYINRGRESNIKLQLHQITIKDAGNDEIDIAYEYNKEPFERIRRITGYLVGTLDRFNNAKRAEVLDRVSHSIEDDCEEVYVS